MSAFRDTATALTAAQSALVEAMGDTDFDAIRTAATNLLSAIDAHLATVIPLRQLLDKPKATPPYFSTQPKPQGPTATGDTTFDAFQKSLDAQRSAVRDGLSKQQYSSVSFAAKNVEGLLYGLIQHINLFVLPALPS